MKLPQGLLCCGRLRQTEEQDKREGDRKRKKVERKCMKDVP